MKISVQTTIQAPREKVWAILTDIENAPNTISGIESVRVLEKPASGVEGLKWEETRTLFGKTAKETMWITEAKEGEYYKTRAENSGALYISTMRIDGEDGDLTLTMDFEGIPQTIGARIMSLLFLFFKGATKKAMEQDLVDIKAAAEAQS